MKKSLLLAGILLLWGTSVSYWLTIDTIFSDGKPTDDDAYVKVLNENESRWYSDAALSDCTNSSDEVTITSPIVSDELMYEVPEYLLLVSPYRVDKIKSGDSSVDTSKIITKSFKREWKATEISFKIWESDGLSANTAYYATIIPVDEYDVIWTPSKEVCFQLNANMCMMDSECDTFDVIVNPPKEESNSTSISDGDGQSSGNSESSDNSGSSDGSESSDSTGNSDSDSESDEEGHGAASDCVSMKLANVTHVINWNTITLKWTAVDGDEVEIAVFVPDDNDPSEGQYKRIGTAKMSAEKFDYKMTWDGEYNFILRNACGEVRYKADAKMWSEPEKIVPPATGPAENVLYIAIAAIILYGVYTIFFRKSENN